MVAGWLHSFFLTSQNFGLKIDRNDSDALMFAGVRQFGHGVTAFVNKFGIDFAEFQDGVIAHAPLDHLTPCPRTLDFLATTPNIPKVIVSSGARAWIDRALGHLGMAHFFHDQIIISYEDSPHELKAQGPRVFTLAAERLGVAPDQLVMVDDNDNNLRHARALGATTLLITHGITPAHPVLHADFTIDKLDQIPTLINQGSIPWLHDTKTAR